MPGAYDNTYYAAVGYECRECWQTYNSKSDFAKHQRVHEKEHWEALHGAQVARDLNDRADAVIKADLVRLLEELRG